MGTSDAYRLDRADARVAPAPPGHDGQTSSSHPRNGVTRLHVSLPVMLFRLAWLLIFALHAFCIAYFAVATAWYARLPTAQVALPLTAYGMIMDLRYANVIVACHAFIGAWHMWVLLRMVLVSVQHRRLFFQRPSGQGSQSSAARKLKDVALFRCYRRVCGRQGWFGLEGPFFNVIFALRETLEAVLQTYQAYLLSRFVPRVGLNAFYVGLLVSNCWATPLIFHLYKGQRVAMQRLLCLVVDVALDFTAAVGVTVTLAAHYAQHIEWDIVDFPITFWYDMEWLITAMNEFQLMLVTSWVDLGSRMFFAVGMLLSIAKVKYLIQPNVDTAHEPDLKESANVNSEQTSTRTMIKSSVQGDKDPHGPHIAHRIFEVLLVVWGVVILAVCVHANLQPSPRQCIMQVHPWFNIRPACALLEVNCKRLGVDGKAEEFEELLGEVDTLSLVCVVARGCPKLEIPPALETYHNLVGLLIVDSTVSGWGEDAALTASAFPNILFVFFERVILPNATVPVGLLATDFPPLLMDIEFCESNIADLPSTIADKWNPGMFLYVEHANLTSFPMVLLDMDLTIISLGWNRLESVPFELLSDSSSGLVLANFIGNPIREITEQRLGTASNSLASSLLMVYLDDTNLSTPLPKWLEAEASEATSCRVVTRRAPLCASADLSQTIREKLCLIPESSLAFPAFPASPTSGT